MAPRQYAAENENYDVTLGHKNENLGNHKQINNRGGGEEKEKKKRFNGFNDYSLQAHNYGPLLFTEIMTETEGH